MNSCHWVLTLGLQEGYHTTQQVVPTLAEVGAIYQQVAEEIFRETKIYISASVHSAKTLYHKEWGCPEGGEETVVFMGCCNPVFTQPKAYEAVLKLLAKRLKERFHQKTAMLEIMAANAIYLTESEGEGK